MPKRKITQAVFEKMMAAYEAWDPQDKTVEELFEPFDISKQAFYAECRRRGIPTRHRPGSDLTQYVRDRPHESAESMEVMVEMLVEARLKIQQLQAELSQYRDTSPGGAAAN